MPGRKARRMLFYTVWLALVGGGVLIALIKREEEGITATAEIVFLAIGMLLLFTIQVGSGFGKGARRVVRDVGMVLLLGVPILSLSRVFVSLVRSRSLLMAAVVAWFIHILLTVLKDYFERGRKEEV